MNQEPQARLINFGRPPKGERRVRFADTMGMELVSIFLFELINEYFQHSRTRKQIKATSHNTHHHHYHSNNGYNDTHTTSSNGTKSIETSSYQSGVSLAKSNTSGGSSPASSHATSNNYYYSNSYHHNNNNNSISTSSNSINNSSSHYNHHYKSSNVNSHQYDNKKANYNTATCLTPSSSPYAVSQQSSHSSAALQRLTNNQTTTITTPSTHTSSSPLSPSSSAAAVAAAATTSKTYPSFTYEFTQPISLLSFNERVKLNKVHLETCQINSTAGHVSVSCTIRVLNISYDKSVIVRYTTDDWRTFTDSLASYKPGSSDGWSDRFSSTFTVTEQVKSFQTGQRIIFAIRCTFDGTTVHWDNNGGLNYAIKSSMSSSSNSSSSSSFSSC